MEFKCLGIEGDWDNFYLIMCFESEVVIVQELMKFVMLGQLYCGFKLVMWFVVEKIVFVEVEIEYYDYQFDQIWVKFLIVEVGGIDEVVVE